MQMRPLEGWNTSNPQKYHFDDSTAQDINNELKSLERNNVIMEKEAWHEAGPLVLNR